LLNRDSQRKDDDARQLKGGLSIGFFIEGSKTMTKKVGFNSSVALIAITFALTGISAQAGQLQSSRWIISSSAAEEQRAQAGAAQRAQQQQERQVQEQTQRAQQERQLQEQAQKAQQLQQERQLQEQAQRAQQLQQERQLQEQTQRAQQLQQERQLQEQTQRAQQLQQERQLQEQAQRAQQLQERQLQIQAQKAQQLQERQLQEQAQKAQQERAQETLKEQQIQQRQAQGANERARELQLQNQQRQIEEARTNQANLEERQLRERAANVPPLGITGHAPAGIPAGVFAAKRGATPPPLNLRSVPIKTAAPAPFIAPNISAAQRQQALLASQNLQAHLIPIPMAQVPVNIPQIRNQQLAFYTNNYPYFFDNRPFYINRQNTYVNELGPGYYPSWYTPAPGWRFCNGFALGSLMNGDLNWVRAGWEPCWGPPPEGFVCESDYVPTPWIYFPAINAWRQAGYPDYVDYGPPPDYTGPITVEILEPVKSVFMGPDGVPHRDVINELYFYNAYFYSDFERWGYTNDRGYFIWLNV
jgi:hypothetical protein